MEGAVADVENGDVLRLGCGLIYDGLYDVVNVWHILCNLDVGIDWASATTFIQTYCDDLYDDLKAPLNDEMGTGSISVANVTQATTLGSIAWSPTWSGAEAGEATAAGVCCFAWARTYKPRVQIRKYYGVFGEVNVTTGSWTGTVQNACVASMTFHIASTQMAPSKFFQGIAYNRTLGTYQAGVSVAVSAEPAYQRRRKRGRGS